MINSLKCVQDIIAIHSVHVKTYNRSSSDVTLGRSHGSLAPENSSLRCSRKYKTDTVKRVRVSGHFSEPCSG